MYTYIVKFNDMRLGVVYSKDLISKLQLFSFLKIAWALSDKGMSMLKLLHYFNNEITTVVTNEENLIKYYREKYKTVTLCYENYDFSHSIQSIFI